MASNSITVMGYQCYNCGHISDIMVKNKFCDQCKSRFIVEMNRNCNSLKTRNKVYDRSVDPNKRNKLNSKLEKSSNMSTICLEAFQQNDDNSLKCGHRFDEHCIFKWCHTSKTSPNCRCAIKDTKDDNSGDNYIFYNPGGDDTVFEDMEWFEETLTSSEMPFLRSLDFSLRTLRSSNSSEGITSFYSPENRRSTHLSINLRSN